MKMAPCGRSERGALPWQHTVDEQNQDASLHGVVGIGDEALQGEGQFLVLAADFDQLPVDTDTEDTPGTRQSETGDTPGPRGDTQDN